MIAGLGGSAAQVTGVERSRRALHSAVTSASSRGIGAQFLAGDAYQLPFPDGHFDVVVAHQVLQHLADPVLALRECLRVTAPGGVVAVRDADYSAMSYFPAPLGLREWTHRYRAIAHANGAEPDAGRHLIEWALAAGCGVDRLAYSTSTWVYSNVPGTKEPSEFAESWCRRVDEERFRSQLGGVLGICGPSTVEVAGSAEARSAAEATDAAVDRIVDGWRQWAEDPSAVFVMPHGELVIRR